MIQTQNELEKVIEGWQKLSRVAVDTEADSLHSYFEKLCLVQIGDAQQNLLVDPLADLNLQPLLDYFSSREIILHGADFDLRMLRRGGELNAPRVFDTVIAARLCGVKEFSLAALVKQHFGVTLTKTSQKADWSQRPLTDQMMDYARDDTNYLHRIAEYLEKELHRLNRREWFEESCERIVALSQIERERDLERVWRIKGSHPLDDRTSAILRHLWFWREKEAGERDVPAFRIMRNEELLALTQSVAAGSTSIPNKIQNPRRERLVQAIKEARDIPEENWPRKTSKPKPPPNPEGDALFDRLKHKRDKAAEKLDLDPSLIASRQLLEKYVYLKKDPKDLFMNWQRNFLEI